MQQNVIYIYNDEGVSKQGPVTLKTAFTWTTPDYGLKEISAEEVISGEWRKNAKAFVMPGGADLPYCKKLNGKGNHQIREFVENGGCFIGFCAGAYYGGSYVDFDRGGPLEVLGDRELKFYPAAVMGPILGPYFYDSEQGAKIARVTWEDTWEDDKEIFDVYFNGGGYFQEEVGKVDSKIKVLSRYMNPEAKGKAAVVLCQVGKGKAILTGVHPESSAVSKGPAIKEQVDGWENLKENVLPSLKNLSHVKFFQRLMGFI